MDQLCRLLSLGTKLKLGNVLLGGISLACVGATFVNLDPADLYMLAAVTVAFLFSSVIATAVFLGIVPVASTSWQRLEAWMHGGIGTLLAIGWVLFMRNTIDWDFGSEIGTLRFISLIFVGINTLLYGFVAFYILRETYPSK